MEDARPELLFLSHRIPYPPDKGDKIRSYRWLLALAERFRIHLGTFVDDPADWVHTDRLQALCASSLFLPLSRRGALARATVGLLSGSALTFPYYSDRRLRRWIGERLAAGTIGHIFMYSSAMAQYAADPRSASLRRVIDFVDVDSDKWSQYALRQRWPKSWIYRREARKLARAEAEIAARFDCSLFVSAPEADLFRARLDAGAARATHVNMGVDCDYFRCIPDIASPYPGDRDAIVFTGAMDYWANADAVVWFAREILPLVRVARPQALLAIVGARPGIEVRQLAGRDILVTGRVPDVRPYLQHARCAVAPMRIARGVQSKILEAMAMSRAVVTTAKGLEGIDATPGRDLLAEDAPRALADAVVAVLGGAFPALGQQARRLVEQHYGWAAASARLVDIVSGDSADTDLPIPAGALAGGRTQRVYS